MKHRTWDRGRRVGTAAAAAAALSLAAPAAQAATVFELDWTGDPTAAAGPASGSDATARAVGSFEIDAGPGDEVGPAQVLSFVLTLSTETLGPLTLTEATVDELFFAGRVSGDGSVLEMRDLYAVTLGGQILDAGFGCLEAGCPSGGFGNILMKFAGTPSLFFSYASAEAALASLAMTARAGAPEPDPDPTPEAAIPLPAGLPLLAGALGLLAALRRRAG